MLFSPARVGSPQVVILIIYCCIFQGRNRSRIITQAYYWRYSIYLCRFTRTLAFDCVLCRPAFTPFIALCRGNGIIRLCVARNCIHAIYCTVRQTAHDPTSYALLVFCLTKCGLEW